MKSTVLVLDDDPAICNLLKEDLPEHGFNVLTCATCKQAHELVNENPVQAILLDYRLPDGSGSSFFHSIQKKAASVPVIFITNFPDIEQAVQLIKQGATDYILKPFSVASIADRLRRAIEIGSLRSEVSYYRKKMDALNGKHDFIGSSPSIQAVRKAIEELIRHPSTPVLISGETGTGKDVVARLIHKGCHGESQPFIEVDCPNISKNLFESELFGHESASDKEHEKTGIFELGNDGTIFLDEVSEISIDLQATLLRVLETRRFRKVGGIRPLTFGARVIASTNRNLLYPRRFKRF